MMRRPGRVVLILVVLAGWVGVIGGCGGGDDASGSATPLTEPAGVTGEQRWLARAMFAEALDQPAAARKAVASVVLNRVDAKDFPDTVYGVLHQKNGFTSVTTDSRLWRLSDDWGGMNEAERRGWIDCLNEAKAVLGGDRLAGVIAFKNTGVKDDAYFRALRPVKTLGKLEFYAVR
ncbi:MAG: cell wall hydrolase [Planctomycetota bacterium]